jgi:hypothetical protein
LDWSASIVELARQRRPTVRFREGTHDNLSNADWVVASGLFNYEHGWSKKQTADAIEKMWEASRRGIAVTVLRVPAEGRLHYRAAELQTFVEGLDWGELQLDRSYLPNDLCLRAWRTR